MDPRTLPCLALVAAALAGCTDENPDADDVVVPELNLTLPANIDDSAAVTLSVMGVPSSGQGVMRDCGEPAVMCAVYAFDIPYPDGWNATSAARGNHTMDGATGAAAPQEPMPAVLAKVSLAWGVTSNDFDILLRNVTGASLASDFASPPGTTASAQATIGPGSYEVVVTAVLVAADTYRLAVEFEAV